MIEPIYIYPYVRFAMHHVFLENYFIERTLWDHEIIFIESGKLKITINDQEYLVEENDVILLRPGENNKIEWAGVNCAQPHVHFDFYKVPDSEKVGVSMITKAQMTEEQLHYFREDFYKSHQIDIPYVFHPSDPIIIRNLLYKIIEEFTYKHPYSETMLQGLLSQLISEILKQNEMMQHNTSIPHSQSINELTVYMAENIDKNLSLEDFSNYTGLSKWSLIQIFQKTYHDSPMQYFYEMRYYRAKNLLQFTFLSVKEIAFKMGYQDPQTFSRWFKNMEGHSPNHFRKNIQNGTE